MSTDQFTTKYNGQFIDVDGKYGAQCVDLMRKYLVDVLGLNAYVIPPTDYAKNIFNNFPNKGTDKFTKVFNSANNYPRKGDIVFWGFYPFITGFAGHVAICTWADSMHLVAFSQNYPTGSASVLRNFNYKGVMGWLSPKI